MNQKSKSKSSNEMTVSDSKHRVEPDSPKPEPSQPVPIIKCPPELGPLARQEWDRIVGHLAATGVLSHFDRGPLAVYCAAYGHWIEATEAIQKYGSMMKSPSGYPVQSPYVAIANRQAETMMRIASEFGFTPASRGRLWMLSNNSTDLLDLEGLDGGNTKW
jgi:P27 family predicted phage terminase small subunit